MSEAVEGPRGLHRLPATAAAAAGAVVGALVMLLVMALPASPLRLAFALLVALAIPLSPSLSRRVVALACWLFAGTIVLWLVPIPSHGGLLAVLAGAAAGGAWAHGLAAGRPWRSLLPRPRLVDALPFVVGGVVAANLPVLGFTGPARVMGQMMRVWDLTSHFAIIDHLRQHHVLQPFAPLFPDGTAYAFSNYPTSYHVVAASFTELAYGPWVPDPIAGLEHYLHMFGGLFAMLAAVVVASFTQIPLVRRNPFGATVAAGLVASLMVLGPGMIVQEDGHPNFGAGCVLAIAAIGTSIACRRAFSPLSVSVLGASVAGALGCYAPMGVIAALAALVCLLPMRAERLRPTRREVVAAVVLLVVWAGVAVGLVRWITSQISPAEFVELPGGLSRVDGRTLFAAIGLTLAVGLAGAATALGRHASRADHGLRLAVGAVPVLAGFVAFFVLAGQTLATSGEVLYYPMKLVNGVCIIAFAYLATGIAMLVRLPPGRPGRWASGVRGVLALVTAASMAVVFGPPRETPYTPDTMSIGALYLTHVAEKPDDPRLVQAVDRVARVPLDSPVMWVGQVDSHVRLVVESNLVAAATHRYSDRQAARANAVLVGSQVPRPPIDVLVELLDEEPGLQMVVGPRAYLEFVKRRPDLGRRLLILQ